MRKRSPDLSGPLTEENLKRFRVDVAVIGADAVLAASIFHEREFTVGQIKQALSAKRVLVRK